MPRYTARRPRAAWDGEEIEFEPDPESFTPPLEVDGAGETDTGLVDRAGHSIMRIANPIGFQAEIE